MAQNERKKVAEKKLIGFTQEALDQLSLMENEFGRNQTQIINDLLTGKGRFTVPVEREIENYAQEHSISRRDAVEAMLVEAIAMKSQRPSNDALPRQAPKPATRKPGFPPLNPSSSPASVEAASLIPSAIEASENEPQSHPQKRGADEPNVQTHSQERGAAKGSSHRPSLRGVTPTEHKGEK